jgi:hypothetical protein
MALEKDKPGLMIAVMNGLKKKGKVDGSSEPSDAGDAGDGDHEDEVLKEIAADLLQAIQDKDVSAMADLLKEVCQCCQQSYEEDNDDHSSSPTY